jgi:hypothetical protein
LLACLAIIVAALFLLGFLRKHDFGGFYILGFALDAIVTAGVVSNLIIFALMMATRLSSFRTTLLILLLVNGALLLIATLLGILVGGFNFPMVFLSYVVSFLFWLTIHWIWSQIRTSTQPVA